MAGLSKGALRIGDNFVLQGVSCQVWVMTPVNERTGILSSKMPILDSCPLIGTLSHTQGAQATHRLTLAQSRTPGTLQLPTWDGHQGPNV